MPGRVSMFKVKAANSITMPHLFRYFTPVYSNGEIAVKIIRVLKKHNGIFIGAAK